MVLIGSIILFLGVILSVILLLMEKKEDWSEYNSYILSILWSPSVCFNKEQNQTECFDRLDELNINNSFIIHGLWPAFDSSYCTSKCNNDTEVVVKFSEEKEKSLSEIWPGLWSSNQKMWNDEYNKHGYCYIKRLRKDVEKDIKNNDFNPLINLFNENKKDFDMLCRLMLSSMMSECSKAFERLPILMYVDILRNILYCGVWSRFKIRTNKRKGEI